MNAAPKQFRLYSAEEVLQHLIWNAMAERGVFDHCGADPEMMLTFDNGKLVNIRVEFQPTRREGEDWQ